MAATTTLDPRPPPATADRRQRQLVLGAMCLSLVLVVASVSMLNLALRDITLALGASPTEQHWIVDGYAVALAALLLPFGALGDRFGRRRALLAGIGLFGLAAFLTVFADSPAELIALRVASGAGAALIMPGTLATITSVFPAGERARAVGLWAGFAGAGGILGMLASGALLEGFWWGSIFVLTAVLAAVAFVVSLVAVPDTRDPDHANLDPVGSVLSVLAIGGLVLGIIEGPVRGWGDWLTLTGLLGGATALAAWLVWSLRTERPLLDPRYFRLRGFSTGSFSLFLQFFAMFGFFLVGLQYLQLILEFSPLQSAASLLPMVVVLIPLSQLSARLSERYGQGVIGGIGLATSAVGFVLLSTLTADSGYWPFLGGLLVMGAGMALAATPATNAIVGSLPQSKQGVASAVNDTARELGAAFGIAVLGSAFNSAYRGELSSATTGLPAELADVAGQAPAAALEVADQLGSAGAGLATAARDGFMAGMDQALWIGAGLLVAGAVFNLVRGQRGPAPVPMTTPDPTPESVEEPVLSDA